jgi:peptidoglycan/LPS O-acetylase OafA/YrhL
LTAGAPRCTWRYCLPLPGEWLHPGWIGYGLAVRGYAGVNVFFALSGFLICGKLLREQQQRAGISLKRFYLVRSFHILPALSLYLAALAALAAAGWVKASGWEFMSALVFVRNYFPLFCFSHYLYLDALAGGLNHLWIGPALGAIFGGIGAAIGQLFFEESA